MVFVLLRQKKFIVLSSTCRAQFSLHAQSSQHFDTMLNSFRFANPFTQHLHFHLVTILIAILMLLFRPIRAIVNSNNYSIIRDQALLDYMASMEIVELCRSITTCFACIGDIFLSRYNCSVSVQHGCHRKLDLVPSIFRNNFHKNILLHVDG